MSSSEQQAAQQIAQALRPALGTSAAPPEPVPGLHGPGAWQKLMHALGHDLQGGLYRAERSRRRIARLR